MKNLAIISILTALAGSLPVNAAIMIAHRGASYDAPENTITSQKLAYAQGAEATECDIHLTRDGKIVLMHDYDTARTGSVSNRIAVTDLADLRKVDVANWGKFKGKGFAETVPLLEEALAALPKGKRLFIEIKAGPEILPELQRVLKKARKKPVQTPLIGFNYDTVKEAKALLPRLEVSWLVSSDSKTKQFPPVEQLIEKAKAARLDGLDLNYGFPIDREFVQKVHSAGLKLYTWTVNDPEVARKQAEAGVDGITTDRPQWLREQIAFLPTK